tara:strand:- start:156 stop:413 length:258 start_codon:yes stop_codon:yes gene_type:complete
MIGRGRDRIDAGWSSPVARQAHNLKVAGSNPAPATNEINSLDALRGVFFYARLQKSCTRFFETAGKSASNLTVTLAMITNRELER